MNILYSGDARIGDGVLTSLLSLLKNVSAPLHVYILTAEMTVADHQYRPLTDQQAAFLNHLVSQQRPGSDVTKIDITDLFNQQLPVANMATRFTPGCMLRLYADEVPQLPDRLLYLDNDVLCRQDCQTFYQQSLAHTQLVGVLDHYGKWFFHHRWRPFDYMNSGVLLLNMPEIKRTGLFADCRQRMQTKKMFMPDQSALNKLATTKRLAPTRYNEQHSLKPNTVFQHFSTTLHLFPKFHTQTVKPWQPEAMHQILHVHAYDDILQEYTALAPQLKGSNLHD
ncbi:MAG: glycosyltransferase family 8 protein [Schleiferilactobacillus harbinensis]|nr:glycosyltransferase family 8 protein [Schleiferilactobacillus harbinensis]MCI1913909.1 glycosyltransferase family 8 protein [Schleiferilactobacillus harbinensis]